MRRWILPAIVALFVMAGSLKGVPVLARLPVDLTVALGALVWLAMASHVIRRGSLPRTVLPILGVFSLLAIPLLWTHFTPYAIDKSSRLFTLTLPACLAPVVLFDTRTELRRLVLSWAAICAIVVVAASAYPVPESDYAGAPIGGISVGTIGLGRAGGVLLIIATSGLLYGLRPRLVGVLAILLGAIAMLTAGSRGPLLGVAVCIVAMLLVLRPTRRIVVLGATALIVAGSLFFAYSRAPEQSQFRLLAAAHGSFDNSSLQRVLLFSIARQEIATRPIGLGWGGFEGIAPTGYRYPHNFILELLVETGWVISVVLLGWIALAWIRIRRLTRSFEASTALCLLTFAFVNAMVSGDINDNRTLFLAIGMCLALWARTPRQAKDQTGTKAPAASTSSTPVGRTA